MNVIQKKVLVSGQVQGVGFRYSTIKQAQQLGLIGGYVKNLNDGRVEAVFQGPADRVEALITWCHSGPSGASVDRVDVTNEAVSKHWDTIEIEYI